MPIDSTPPPISNDPANDGYEIRNADEHHHDDADREAEHKAREAARDADHKARTIRQRISDAIEDVIPGDSDHDGH